MVGQPGLFDLSDRYAALSAAGDPLERLASVVDFELFRGPLVVALRRSDRGKERPPDRRAIVAGPSIDPRGNLGEPGLPRTRSPCLDFIPEESLLPVTVALCGHRHLQRPDPATIKRSCDLLAANRLKRKCSRAIIPSSGCGLWFVAFSVPEIGAD
jgi:hypothetical protein